MSPLVVTTIIIVLIHSISKADDEGECDPDNIYNTFIVYGFDETVDLTTTPLQESMDTSRNTLLFRTRAYNYFKENYDLTFNPNVDGDQLSAENADLQVRPIQVGTGLRYHIYAYNNPLQQLSALQDGIVTHRFPVGNSVILGVAYWV